MSAQTHNSQTCDCDMCAWADQQEQVQRQPTIDELFDVALEFASDWEHAPAERKRLVEQLDALWWWNQGRRRGLVANTSVDSTR